MNKDLLIQVYKAVEDTFLLPWLGCYFTGWLHQHFVKLSRQTPTTYFIVLCMNKTPCPWPGLQPTLSEPGSNYNHYKFINKKIIIFREDAISAQSDFHEDILSYCYWNLEMLVFTGGRKSGV